MKFLKGKNIQKTPNILIIQMPHFIKFLMKFLSFFKNCNMKESLVT